MQLCLSNITWEKNKNSFIEFLKFAKSMGCIGIELAPSIIWKEPILSKSAERKRIKEMIISSNLKLVGLHSLLFTRPDLKMFKNAINQINLKKYIFKLIDLCFDLGGSQIVFGSPKNRELCGKSYKNCLLESYRIFGDIASYAEEKKIIFAIEPLSKNETDFLYSLEDALELVKKINNNNLLINLDTKVLFGQGQKIPNLIKASKNHINHVQIGGRGLKLPTLINEEHNLIAKSLKEIDYKKFISLEIRRDELDIKGNIIKGLSFIKKNYLI